MKKQDFILIGILLAAAAALFAVLQFTGNNGAYVQIAVDQSVIQTLPLNEDTEYRIETENGTNTLVISGGYASVTEADCPDKICVRHKKIRKNGESIICLPHKMVITVIDGDAKTAIDAEV